MAETSFAKPGENPNMIDMIVGYKIRRTPGAPKTNSVRTVLTDRVFPENEDEFDIEVHELQCCVSYGNFQLVETKKKKVSEDIFRLYKKGEIEFEDIVKGVKPKLVDAKPSTPTPLAVEAKAEAKE